MDPAYRFAHAGYLPSRPQGHFVSARAPWQPSVAGSRTHFPAEQISMNLSVIQNPAPSLKDRPAHAQPLAGTGISAGAYAGGDWSASGGDGAGWARAAESKRALIKIDLASIVSTIVPPLLTRCLRMHAVDDNQRWRHLHRRQPRTFPLFKQPFSNIRRRQGCPTGARPPTAEHQDTAELRRGDRQVSPAARGEACRVARMEPTGRATCPP